MDRPRRSLSHIAHVAVIEKALDTEAARWQERIEQTIRRHGLTPSDPSGNESGDPLDWTADQVNHALGELSDQVDELKEQLAALAAGRHEHGRQP